MYGKEGRREKTRRNEDYEQICLFRSDDCPLSCIREGERESEMESDGPGSTRNLLFSLFLFSSFSPSVGRFRMAELMYAYVCSIREATTGEAKKGLNTILVTFANTKK